MSSPAVTLTATLTDPSGNPVQGKVVLTLVNFGSLVPVVANTVTVANLSYTGLANGSGQVSITFWGNYQLNVPNSFYQVQVYGTDANGVVNGAANLSGAYQFNTTGTFDLSALAPISAYAGVVVTNPLTAIVTNPSGTQSISTYPLNVSGGFTSVGPSSLAQINRGLYVGADFSSQWGSTDIGAQINAAYAALPSTGGVIYVAPQSNGAAYAFTTPIVFGTQAKYVRLLGIAPGVSSGTGEVGSLGGSTLYFSPKTGTANFALSSVSAASVGLAVYHGTFAGGGSNALAGKTFAVYGFAGMFNNGYYVATASTATTLTLANRFAGAETLAATAVQMATAVTFNNDGTPGSTNFDGFAVANTIEDMTIANALTGTVTCNNYGTSAGSMVIGLDNSGAARLMTKNLRILGFGVGRQCISPVQWGGKDFDMSLSRNGVGMIMHNGMENYGWIGGTCITNGIGIQFSGGGGDPTFTQVSFDSNGSIGASPFANTFGWGVVAHESGGQSLTFVGCHFENLISGDASGAAPPTYVQNFNGPVTIHGGIASNDNNSAQPSSYTAPFWFRAGGTYAGAALTTYGLALVGSNQANALIFQADGTGGFLSGTIGAPAPSYTAFVGGTGAAGVTNLYTGISTTQTWTPVLTGFTVVGTAPIVNANCHSVGGVIYYTIALAIPAASSLAAGSNSNISLPVPVTAAATCVVSDLNRSFTSSGLSGAGGTNNVYTVGWTAGQGAAANVIYISGFYW